MNETRQSYNETFKRVKLVQEQTKLLEQMRMNKTSIQILIRMTFFLIAVLHRTYTIKETPC
ncbi:hypothetical protein D3C81_943510 [compost metagenome]